MDGSSQGVSGENRTADVLDSGASVGCISGVVSVGIAATRTLLFDDPIGTVLGTLKVPKISPQLSGFTRQLRGGKARSSFVRMSIQTELDFFRLACSLLRASEGGLN
jgi:hypothetical protein